MSIFLLQESAIYSNSLYHSFFSAKVHFEIVDFVHDQVGWCWCSNQRLGI